MKNFFEVLERRFSKWDVAWAYLWFGVALASILLNIIFMYVVFA